MFGILAVAYLFLGGAGAGAMVVALLADVLWVRQPFGASSYVSLDEATPGERMLAFSLLMGFAALVLGVLCLVFDLGRLDRVVTLFANPSFSLLTVGSFALAALIACAALLVVVRFAYVPNLTRSVVTFIEIVAIVIGIVVMVYTGLLLQTLGGLAFWRSPLVPVLFVLSSLSCGCAVILIAGLFVDKDEVGARIVRALTRVDIVLIALEAVVAAVFVVLALGSNHPAAAASAQQLLLGDGAALWWVGFVACGLAAPVVIESIAGRGFAGARTALALAAILVLVGGLGMRASIVEVGEYRALELENVTQQQTINQSGAPALGSS